VPDHELSYYDLLGLTPDASHDEIRTAYDSIMVRIRPNIVHASASTIRLAAAVKEAWETLGDEGKRHEYDESLRGSATYADLWRRREQSPFLEKRDAWFDQQVRRAQSERQSAHEYESERKQLKEDFEAVAASNAAIELAREASRRTEAAQKAAAASGRPEWRRLLVAAAVVLAIIAAVIGARALQLGRQTSMARAVPAVSAAAVALASIAPVRPRAPNRSSTARPPSRIINPSIAQPPANAAGGTTSATPPARTAPAQPAQAHSQSQITVRTTTSIRPRPRAVTRPAYVCKTEAIASVTRDGSIVDLSDGKRYQLGDPVDRAQAGGWSTGTSVAECAWPAAMNRAASLDVNGYTVHALPAAIVAVAPTSTANPATSAPACADASITEVADDGYGVALSDGHVYSVDNAGHVTASAWLVGDAVTVCSAPARGTSAFTVARFGAVVDVARTRSLVSSASTPTLCVVRLIAARADDGSRVVFNDGHSYRVDSSSGRSIVAAWSVGERVTVCIKVAAGAVNATLAHGSLVAGAVRAD
jgi:hypothetical protein